MFSILKRLSVLCFVVFAVSACTEVELASHVAKTVPLPGTSKSQGTFKVGSPYKIQGKTYYPKETYSFEQTGIASWYGPGFHGKKTANGETFDQNELTAAHKTLQMPSLVRVTNLENGRSIVARVNDRGPFSKGRIIDMSKRSAELLGFKNQGTARVKVQVLTQESLQIAEMAKKGQNTRGTEVALNSKRHQTIAQRQPVSTQQQAQPAVARTASVAPVESVELESPVPGHLNQGRFYPDPVVKTYPVSPTNIYVQVASVTNPANAQKLAGSLQAIGKAQVQPARVNGQDFYRVRIGPISNVKTADLVLKQLSSAGQHDAIVVVD